MPNAFKSKSIQLHITRTIQATTKNSLPPIEFPTVIAHLLPVGLTDISPTAAFLLLVLASPPDEQDEDEDKYDSHDDICLLVVW